MRSIVSSLLAVALLSSGAIFAEGDSWTSVDIGTATEGSTTAVGEDGLTVTASGSDIWNSADSFRFVYRSISGDFSIRLRAESISPTNGWSKAGVMVRQSTDPDSMHAMMVATPEGGNGFAFQQRTATGGASTHTAGGATAYPNSWVRLDRIGGLIVAYKATDAAGQNFEQVGTPLALNVTDPVLVGLCVTAHADGQLCTAEFRDLNLQAIPTGTGEGLAASYFANAALSGDPALSRVDSTIDFAWGYDERMARHVARWLHDNRKRSRSEKMYLAGLYRPWLAQGERQQQGLWPVGSCRQ